MMLNKLGIDIYLDSEVDVPTYGVSSVYRSGYYHNMNGYLAQTVVISLASLVTISIPISLSSS